MPRILILSNPRSGSNYLLDLLTCHPEIQLEDELLNDEFGLLENPLETIEKSLAELHNTFVGFKVFPEQLFMHKLHFGDLVESIGATYVIVLWREDILESLASRRIADANGEWYATTATDKIRTVKVELEDLETYTRELIEDWEKIGSQWPVHVRPIFVKFEDLIQQPIAEVKRVLAELSCASDHVVFNTPSVRQNPAPVHQKVTNFHGLPFEQREKKLTVDKILLEKINVSLQIPSDLLQFAPDREPCMPSSGWKYRVAEPYLPNVAKQNAFDAIQSGSISSAGLWPREMAKRLRSIFHCPVAQPCSNGFTALLLAFQATNIGEDDEVIMPTMTMIAVPNAVHFARGKSVFADNAKDSYNPGWKEYETVSTSKTKAIVVTHTYGVPAPDIENIASMCKARGWVLIEDISECVGITCTTSVGEEKLLGTFGDFAIASMYANKIIHGGDGGFVIAQEAKQGRRLASIVNHGFTPSFHFVHFEQAPNAKIHGIGAAIASGCLDEMEYVMDHRSNLSKWYRAKLTGLPVELMPQCGSRDTPWVFGIQCKSKQERTQLRAFMAKSGIETRDFFFNLHLQPAYSQRNQDGSLKPPPSLPNAEVLGSSGFYLPTHSNLTEDDVDYICTIMKNYFAESSIEGVPTMVPPPRRPQKCSVQIQPDGFALQVRKYRETGELQGVMKRGHHYLEAVKLGYEAEELLFHERFDQIENLLDAMKSCLARSEGDPLWESMGVYFGTYIDYFTSQAPIEQPLPKPWINVDLNDKSFNHSRNIPTTTDPETLQTIVWLLQTMKPGTIWEIGSWLGHATALMAEVCNSLELPHRIFACDAFKWQAWMDSFVDESNISPDGKSFTNVFRQNLKPFIDNIEVVQWPYDISKLPTVLENQKPQLIFLDITQEDEDLEQIWSFIKPNLTPNETIILFNGLTYTSIPFFTRHAKELKALAKPSTMAKVFQYTDPSAAEMKSLETYEDVMEKMKATLPLKRQLKFHTSPGWDHHHRNLFCKSIELLREELHSDDAEILFIPAVEESMCDEPEIFYNNPWIGIIHSVASHPELFYTPDLNRICSTKASMTAAMKNCKGLFTLTTFQAEYLKTHLPKNLPKFPIQRLLYPAAMTEIQSSSRVPQLMKEDTKIDVVHIGSFARDFELFFKAKLPPTFKKVFVAADTETQEISKGAPADVEILSRLSAEDYEEKLNTSVVFLTLKYEGAANTLILECIARNVPILSPAISSCTEYLGKEYPLLYDPAAILSGDELKNLLTLSNIEKAISYLQKMDKEQFSHLKFTEDVRKGAVMLSIPPTNHQPNDNMNESAMVSVSETRSFDKFDVTICICSYKRTRNLPKLLNSLWEKQDFTGTYQIIIWNNNDSRTGVVRDYALKYINQNSSKKSIELVASTKNYYCSIRFAMPALMRSDCLLICDDDIIPGSNFVSFFYSAHQRQPKDVLCVRGHEFLPHHLEPHDPANVWMEYDSLRFRDDHQPEQLIHFVHADACLIPKQALQEVASVSMPDLTYALVDDYWMSFILNHKFGRNLRKLSTAGLKVNPIVRTEDSDTPGLALHTRPEVQDARLRLYVHHMLQGWPKWEQGFQNMETQTTPEEIQMLGETKRNFWKSSSQIGFNISSTLDKTGIADLVKTGAKCVRIGAVGVGGQTYFEFSEFLTEPQDQLARLDELVKKLELVGINVVITLERRVATPENWQLIAGKFMNSPNVVGYDLINEPFTEHERDLHWVEVEADLNDTQVQALVQKYAAMINSVRKFDKVTPIILEPTFWARIDGLNKFPVEELLLLDSNLVFSVHFYEPMTLTSRVRNKGRYSFPCSIPWYDNIKFSEETYWDETEITEKLKKAKRWAESKGVQIFVGEFGICRDIGGAEKYLQTVIKACKAFGMISFVFSFRDPDWEAMDYEFGKDMRNCCREAAGDNALMQIIIDGISNQ